MEAKSGKTFDIIGAYCHLIAITSTLVDKTYAAQILVLAKHGLRHQTMLLKMSTLQCKPLMLLLRSTRS